jgi:UDP-N-acetylglucosamine--N-acetylmuramyl-(pentapeptide) pyrophosphoryl-undecaprenol N-acetylglucosamine transferase
MPSAYAAADLAVCRSGAMTLAELQAAALPAILVPFPHAAGNHQLHNALSYVKSGGAIVIEDKDLSGDKLLAIIRNLLADRERLTQMRQALAALPKQDTAQLIAGELLRLTPE